MTTESDLIDRLSVLPEEIILQILSLLPSTKLRARTSLLSRRWRHLWSSTPALDFPLDDFPDPSLYTPAVDHCLRLCSASYLTRFRAHACPLPSPSAADFDRWIRFAAARSVRDLALSFFSFQPHRPDLPLSLLLCAPHLSSLKLIRCRFPALPQNFRCRFPALPQNFPGFPALRTLYLSTVTLSDDIATALLSACPLLETLHLCNCAGLTRLEVSSTCNPRLVNLNLERMTRKSVDQLVVRAPSLRFFDFEGDVSRLHLGAVPHLRTAQILSRYWLLLEDQQDWAELVSLIANVEVLAVSCWFFEFHLDEYVHLFGNHLPVFKNLKELHWFGVSITGKNLLALLLCLRECPILEKLCINLDYYEELSKAVSEQNVAPIAFNLGEPGEDDDIYDEPVPIEPAQSSNFDDEDKHLIQHLEGDRVLLSQLKVCTVTQFSDNMHAMQLLEFILGRATVLELLRLTIIPEPEGELELLHTKLSGFAHASQHVQIEIAKIVGNTYPHTHKKFQDLWSF